MLLFLVSSVVFFLFLTIFQMLQNPQMQPQQSSCIFYFKKHNWVTENND